MNYVSWLVKDGRTGDGYEDFYKSFPGYGYGDNEILQLPADVDGTPFWIGNQWIYTSLYDSTMSPPFTNTSGFFAAVHFEELEKIYKFMFHTHFKTTATVTFDTDDKLKIEIVAVPPSNWALTETYAFLKAFAFRTLVILPDSTFLTSLGFGADTDDDGFKQLDVDLSDSTMTSIVNNSDTVSPTDKHNFYIGHDISPVAEVVQASGLAGRWSRRTDTPVVAVSRTADQAFIGDVSRALHVRTNLTSQDMIDSYHGRFTSAMCVVPIHAADEIGRASCRERVY
jgi:hypothetical protein